MVYRTVPNTIRSNHPLVSFSANDKIGNAECKLFDMKAGFDFANEWLIKHRFDKQV